MASFPLLSTGAVAQYPISKGVSYDVDTVYFLDGSTQRCLARGKRLRRWSVNLSQLSEGELANVEQFFDEVQGNAQLFLFTDPLTNEPVANCRLINPWVLTQYDGPGRGSAALWIEETYG